MRLPGCHIRGKTVEFYFWAQKSPKMLIFGLKSEEKNAKKYELWPFSNEFYWFLTIMTHLRYVNIELYQKEVLKN